MSYPLPFEIIDETTSERFAYSRATPGERANRRQEAMMVDLDRLDESDLDEIMEIAARQGDNRTCLALAAIRCAGTDGGWKVPSFEAFQPLLRKWLRERLDRGWIYARDRDGQLYPWLVTGLDLVMPDTHSRSTAKPQVRLTGTAYGRCSNNNSTLGPVREFWSFEAGDVSRRHIEVILERAGLFGETPERNLAHDAAEEAYEEILYKGFAGLYHVTGPAIQLSGFGRNLAEVVGRKVIHDIEASQIKPYGEEGETTVFSNAKTPKFLPLPKHRVLEVFDIHSHESYWISTDHLRAHVFDKSLRDRLVLPESHQSLLDVLTTEVGTFTSDFIEGKSAGSLILGKGVPGVGKTLTAEVYAELSEKPLYSVHAGNLGTTAEDIAKQLDIIFQRARRWNCVLLLDEADVFVLRRNEDVERNAIVAAFLRALEYWEGLLFMTTNRPDDIDEAVLSRCAAIIDYQPPSPAHAERIWQAMADNFGIEIDAELQRDLLSTFPKITGRDIKLLLSLSLKVAKSKGRSLDIQIVRECSLFRGLTPTIRTDA